MVGSEQLISYQGIAGLVSKVRPFILTGEMYTLEVNGPSPLWEQHVQDQFRSLPIVMVDHNPNLSENVAKLTTI